MHKVSTPETAKASESTYNSLAFNHFQYFRPKHPCGRVGNSMLQADSWGGVLGLR